MWGLTDGLMFACYKVRSSADHAMLATPEGFFAKSILQQRAGL